MIFARLRQCAPHRIHASSRAHAHPSPQPKRHLDRFSHFCTCHGTVSSGMPGHALSSKNCPFAWGNLDSHLIHCSFCLPEPKCKTASLSLQPFLHSLPHSVPLLYNGPPLPSQNCPFPWADLDRYLTHGFSDPLESWTQTTSRSVQPFCRAH